MMFRSRLHDLKVCDDELDFFGYLIYRREDVL